MSTEEIRKAYVLKLRLAIEASYKCGAAHRRTVATRASRDPDWPAQVEVFWLTGHPITKRCFAWADPSAPSQVIAVLELPPVIGAATAIQAALASKSKNFISDSSGA